MRFSLLSFIGLTSAAAVTRQAADYGSWAVTLAIDSAANGFQSRDLTAVYSSADLAEPVTVTCTYRRFPGEATTESCDDASFTYSYFGSTVGITQTVQLWGGNVTLSGEKELTQTCNSGSGRACTISGTVPASTAVA